MIRLSGGVPRYLIVLLYMIHQRGFCLKSEDTSDLDSAVYAITDDWAEVYPSEFYVQSENSVVTKSYLFARLMSDLKIPFNKSDIYDLGGVELIGSQVKWMSIFSHFNSLLRLDFESSSCVYVRG